MASIPGIDVDDRRHSNVLQLPLAAPREGLMLHYDDSSRDDWAVEWFHDPRCRNGYTWLVLDDGRIVELADPSMRTPHAGPCLRKNANSVFYGVAAATDGQTLATAPQLASIATICAAVIRHHHWMDSATRSLEDLIVGHDAQAIWTPQYTTRRELWGKVGRKVDPTGTRADSIPVLPLAVIHENIIQLFSSSSPH